LQRENQLNHGAAGPEALFPAGSQATSIKMGGPGKVCLKMNSFQKNQKNVRESTQEIEVVKVIEKPKKTSEMPWLGHVALDSLSTDLQQELFGIYLDLPVKKEPVLIKEELKVDPQDENIKEQEAGQKSDKNEQNHPNSLKVDSKVKSKGKKRNHSIEPAERIKETLSSLFDEITVKLELTEDRLKGLHKKKLKEDIMTGSKIKPVNNFIENATIESIKTKPDKLIELEESLRKRQIYELKDQLKMKRVAEKEKELREKILRRQEKERGIEKKRKAAVDRQLILEKKREEAEEKKMQIEAETLKRKEELARRKLNELEEMERRKEIEKVKEQIRLKREQDKEKEVRIKEEKRILKQEEIEDLRLKKEAEKKVRVQRSLERTIAHRMATVTTINPPIVHLDYAAYDEEQLDEKINEMMLKTDSLYTCTVCGKATSGKSLGKRQNLRDHIEARHVEGVSHFCQVCNAMAKTRNSMRMHVRNYHSVNGKFLVC